MNDQTAVSRDVKQPTGTSNADLYAILGISRKAKRDEIVSAYKKRAKETHPDAGGTKELFQAVQVAYRVLRDADLRAKYDATGQIEEAAVVIEAELVRNELLALFTQYIDRGAAHDKRLSVIDAMKQDIATRIDQVGVSLAKLDVTCEDFKSLKTSISRSGEGVNVFTRECDRKIKENRMNHETLTKTLYMMRKVNDEITFYTSAARMVETFASDPFESQFNSFFAFKQQATGSPFNDIMDMLNERSAQRGKRS